MKMLDKNLNINFEFKENISVILKDSKGDPSKNRLNITVLIYLF